jgi:enoyl-CoA hydratase/carnithine racemase
VSIDLSVTDDGIATITLNRPERRNALDLAMMNALEEAWLRVRTDDAVRVAVLTGTGSVFCAGVDLGIVGELTSGPLRRDVPFDLKGLDLYKPIIAAINGPALGAGTEMLQGTDIRLAVPGATFGLPEVRVGLVPSGGSLARLVRQIPYAGAMKLLLTGEPIGADEALRYGLINEIVAPEALLTRALELARQILRNAPVAVRTAKEVALASAEAGLASVYLLETVFQRYLASTQDAQEGPRAFLERRPPNFQGR